MADAATEEKPGTVEVAEPETKAAAPEAPSREDLRAQGWSKVELDSAEKRGMLKPKDEAAAEKKDEKAPEAAKADAAKAPEKGGDKPAEPAKPKNLLPDFNLTPDQEAEFERIFGKGSAPRGIYFRMKNERQARQAAEEKARALEARIQALESPKPAARQEVDEDGNQVDPEDKPLTLKQLRDLQKAEAEAMDKKNAETSGRAAVVASAQADQEEYAKSVHPDFDDTVSKAKDLIQNLEAMVPERWKRDKIVGLVRNLQLAAAHADKIGLDEYNASMIAYEIGQLHPEYGRTHGDKPKETGTSKDPKAPGGLKPEQMRRIEENTQRRASSASVPDGGGKRTVSVEDVDLATLNKMSYAERVKFREKHPDRYAKLLRG